MQPTRVPGGKGREGRSEGDPEEPTFLAEDASAPTSTLTLEPETTRPGLWTNVGRAIFDGSGEAVAAARTPEEARRIVAAINAVYGMPTEALEAWTIGYIRDPMNDLLSQLESTLAVELPHPERRRSDRRQQDRRRSVLEVTPPPDADWVKD